MKILALQPAIDTPDRYNYQVNYSLWDAIEKITEFKRIEFDSRANYIRHTTIAKDYDVVFAPMNIRFKGLEWVMQNAKKWRKPIVMFDNDDLRRKQDDPLYDGIDIIFSRMSNDNGRTWLPWCVDTDLYTPVYGGEFISMPASIVYPYSTRIHIKRRFSNLVNLEQPKGKDYIKHLQRSKAVICTGSDECNVTRAKVLEAAACGCLVITEKTEYYDRYIPKGMYLTFSHVDEVKDRIRQVNEHYDEFIIERQKEMRDHAIKNSSELQAQKVVAYIESFLNGKPVKDILHSIQNPLDLVEA